MNTSNEAIVSDVPFAQVLKEFFREERNADRIRMLRDIEPEERESYFLAEFMGDLNELIKENSPSSQDVENALEHEIKAIFSRARFRDVSNDKPHVRRIIRN